MKACGTLFKLILSTFLATQLMGCTTPSQRTDVPEKQAVNQKMPSGDALGEVLRDIDQTQKDIQFTRDVINQAVLDQLDAAGQLEKGKYFTHSADYNASGGQNPGETNVSRVERINRDIDVQRGELEKQKKKLATLEQKQQSLQQQSMGCFPADTHVVMADGSTRSFSTIMPGDYVQTYDIGYERKVARKVIETYQVDGNHLYVINDTLQTSGGERLLTQDGWRVVRNLKTGDRVHVGGQMVEIDTIRLKHQNAILHNMQVADTHNFYVSTDSGETYLVHNSGGGGGGK